MADGSRRSVPRGTPAGEVLRAWNPKERPQFLAAGTERPKHRPVDSHHGKRHALAVVVRGREGTGDPPAFGGPPRREGPHGGRSLGAPDGRPTYGGGILLRLRRPAADPGGPSRGPLGHRPLDRRARTVRAVRGPEIRGPAARRRRTATSKGTSPRFPRERTSRSTGPARSSTSAGGPHVPDTGWLAGIAGSGLLRDHRGGHARRRSAPARAGDRIPDPFGARSVPEAPQGGRGPGPPRSRREARAVHVRGRVPRLPVLACRTA